MRIAARILTIVALVTAPTLAQPATAPAADTAAAVDALVARLQRLNRLSARLTVQHKFHNDPHFTTAPVPGGGEIRGRTGA